MKWKKKHRRPEFRDCLHCRDTFEVQPDRASAKTCTPACAKEHRRKYQRAFALARYRENPEGINAHRRADYAENPEAVLARNADWERRNRPTVNAGKRSHYAEKKGAPVRAWRRRGEAARADGQ